MIKKVSRVEPARGSISLTEEQKETKREIGLYIDELGKISGSKNAKKLELSKKLKLIPRG